MDFARSAHTDLNRCLFVIVPGLVPSIHVLVNYRSPRWPAQVQP
jgi:hypothetical protein